MPRLSTLSRSKAIHDASLASSGLFDLLTPAISELRIPAARSSRDVARRQNSPTLSSNSGLEVFFYAALTRASHCNQHKHRGAITQRSVASADTTNRQSQRFRTSVTRSQENIYNSDRCHEISVRRTHGIRPHGSLSNAGRSSQLTHISSSSHHNKRSANEKPSNSSCSHGSNTQQSISKRRGYGSNASQWSSTTQSQRNTDCINKSSHGGSNAWYPILVGVDSARLKPPKDTATSSEKPPFDPVVTKHLNHSGPLACLNSQSRLAMATGVTYKQSTAKSLAGFPRRYHTHVSENKSKQRRFAEGSYLPSDFFNDISILRELPNPRKKKRRQARSSNTTPSTKLELSNSATHTSLEQATTTDIGVKSTRNVVEHMKLLNSVRELEEKLEKAKKDLSRSMLPTTTNKQEPLRADVQPAQPPVVLTKEDYMNLVDLYYYSHNDRFSPESTDDSPTPLILNDYSFTLSSDFSPGANQSETVNEDENYESPLKKIEEILKQRQLREVAVMQVFVDLLLDDRSSNRALFEAYKQLPDPGVAYLPKGIIRLFLQRMSTPWTLSEKSMLRYLALIDDMQTAKIPITTAEWSSAVYLAGRAFSNVTNQEVNNSFSIWNVMEREAGVKGSHVTFNILFDIAVRSGRFALGETILKEMHSRNLRLNRLGRVSLMYYHGLRKDGDGVRKAYRDFVEAGEIVDTLVMNCVIASLLNAQEPQAAEQVYARMKNIQLQLQKGFNRDGGEVLFKQYPDPGGNTIDMEMASNHIGRVLEKAPRLKGILPAHHEDLQSRMPLTPNHLTFRAMIAYHATTSGDLDRLTVLLQEMTDIFHLPLQTITFQLLFKGFAFHGPVGGPRSAWSVHRLELCWNACRAAIKASERPKSPTIDSSIAQTTATSDTVEEDDAPPDLGLLPSITQINAMPPNAPSSDINLQLSRPQPRRLSGWSEFVLDLAAFPRERLKRLERFHATMFDAEDKVQPHEKPGVHTYQSPYFQSTAYTAPEPQLDTEEGEYELPNPSEAGLLRRTEGDSGSDGDAAGPGTESPTQSLESPTGTPHQVAPTRAMVCWLLRAYARNTKSRYKVEEIWNSVRKLYKPKDTTERESVVRVLRRCLRDCDREGSG